MKKTQTIVLCCTDGRRRRLIQHKCNTTKPQDDDDDRLCKNVNTFHEIIFYSCKFLHTNTTKQQTKTLTNLYSLTALIIFMVFMWWFNKFS